MFNALCKKIAATTATFLLVAHASNAQDLPDFNSSACCEQGFVQGYENANSCCDQEFCSSARARIGYSTGSWLGKNEGYTTLAAYHCPEGSSCMGLAPYVDVRLHYLNNQRWAGNFGLGVQKEINFCLNKSYLRGYVFLDFRDSKYDFHKQIMAGVEWLGASCDLRVNTYWPWDDSGHHRRKQTIHYRGGFTAYRKLNDFAWRGVEFEVSKYMSFFDRCHYITVGGYYFNGNQKHTTGILGRVEGNVWRDLYLAVQASYDHHFGGRAFVQFGWDFSLDCNSCCDNCCRPVLREELIILTQDCRWHTNFNTHHQR